MLNKLGEILNNKIVILFVLILGGLLVLSIMGSRRIHGRNGHDLIGVSYSVDLGKHGQFISSTPECTIDQNESSLLSSNGAGYAYMASWDGIPVSQAMLVADEQNGKKKWMPSTKTMKPQSLHILQMFNGTKWVFDGPYTPVSWSKTADILWVHDRQKRVYSIDVQTGKGHRVNNWKKLARILKRSRLIDAGNGVLVLGAGNGKSVEFYDLTTDHYLSSGALPGHYYSGTIGHSKEDGESLFFVSWNNISKSDKGPPIQVSRGLKVLDKNGDEVFRTKISMLNVKFFPSLTSEGVLALAPKNGLRCLWRINAKGEFTPTPYSDCQQDVETVLFSDRGEVMSTAGTLESKSLYLDEKIIQNLDDLGINPEEIEMIAGSSADQGIYLRTRNNEYPHLFALLNGAKAYSLDHFCSFKDGKFGRTSLLQPISATASDHQKVNGFYLKADLTRETGVVISYHGGPYSAWTNEADFFDEQLQARGYHVIKVNYRGSKGYGMNYVQAGWGWVPDKMIGDGLALYDALKHQTNLDEDLPVFAVGSSWGAMLALKAITTHPNVFSGGYLKALPCNISYYVKSNRLLIKNSIKKQNVEKYLITNFYVNLLRTNTNDFNFCNLVIPKNKKVYVLHGSDDLIAPLKDVKYFLSVQSDNSVKGVIANNVGHGLTGEIMFNGRTDEAIQFWESKIAPKSTSSLENKTDLIYSK